MATVALRSPGSLAGLSVHRDMDPYLRQGVPLLETCWKLSFEITNLTLYFEERMGDLEVTDQQEWEHFTPMAMFLAFVKLLLEQANPKQRNQLSDVTVHTMTEALSLIALGSSYNHQLEIVIAQEQASALELQNKDSSVPRKVKKLTKLMNNLEELTKTVDKIMDFYTMKNLGFSSASLPSIEELKEVKKKICDMKSKLKVKELCGLFKRYNENIRTTEETIMCDILGITEDFGQYLHNLDRPVREHRTDLMFLKSFIENREHKIRAEGTIVQEQGRNGLTENLVQLGFTVERASSISASIPDDFIDLQVPSFWAMRYLEHIFSHHPLFSSVSEYPYQEEKTDQFFEQNIPFGGRREPETSNADGKFEWPVKIFNVKDKKNKNQMIKDFLRKEEDDSTKLFFHGTTHKSAVSILESGIHISMGNPGQDFSNGDGFYLAEMFDTADQYGKATKDDPKAIVIFKVPNELVENESDSKDLTSPNSKKEWEQTVLLCQNEYSARYGSRKQIKELKKPIPYIRGPMCKNVTQVKKGQTPKGSGRYNDPAGLQLCIKSDDYAERFGSLINICCVVFY